MSSSAEILKKETELESRLVALKAKEAKLWEEHNRIEKDCTRVELDREIKAVTERSAAAVAAPAAAVAAVAAQPTCDS